MVVLPHHIEMSGVVTTQKICIRHLYSLIQVNSSLPAQVRYEAIVQQFTWRTIWS